MSWINRSSTPSEVKHESSLSPSQQATYAQANIEAAQNAVAAGLPQGMQVGTDPLNENGTGR